MKGKGIEDKEGQNIWVSQTKQKVCYLCSKFKGCPTTSLSRKASKIILKFRRTSLCKKKSIPYQFKHKPCTRASSLSQEQKVGGKLTKRYRCLMYAVRYPQKGGKPNNWFWSGDPSAVEVDLLRLELRWTFIWGEGHVKRYRVGDHQF